jgi:hypothetical protein
LAFLFAAASAWAVSSSLWETDSRDDFDAGEPDDVSIMAPGEVVLGPRAGVTPIDALYVWSLAEDSRGNIYAGTGNDGKVFMLSPGGTISVFAILELQQVFALVFDRNDVLYAGGFPGGKVYSIDVKGKVSEYFDSRQESVWSLVAGSDARLFAATGDEGKIFSIEAAGEGTVLYDSTERRILSLLGDDDGNLYAGSEPGGIVYRIDAAGRPSVLYDTELEEVTAMTMDTSGNLYAVSSPGKLFVQIPPPPAPVAPKTAQGPAGHDVATQPAVQPEAPVPMPGMPAVPSPKKRTCILYKIAEDGTASKFWTSPEKLVFSIIFDGTNLLAGSGDDGIIHLISPTKEDSVYYKADQKQILSLHRSAGGAILAASGNNAAIARFDGGYSAQGTFISPVHDATAISRWGRVFWETDEPPRTSISLATRSGNSENPDDTWSGWSGEHGDSEGFISDSPSARYVQWRATLSTSHPQRTPTLRKVTAAYLQANLAPEVESVDVATHSGSQKEGAIGAQLKTALKGLAAGAVHPEQAGGDKPKAVNKASKAAPTFHEATLKIEWKAYDENGDTLGYALYFKGTDETRWKLLEDELTETSYEWDTEEVPDGRYHVKVVASDSPSNVEGTSLEAEKVSRPFIIDNTSPVVEGLSVTRARSSQAYRITCTVSDALSPIRSAHYNIDAGDWVTVFPIDGVFDAPTETVEFMAIELEEGEHTVVLKAVDYFGNIGAGKRTFIAK